MKRFAVVVLLALLPVLGFWAGRAEAQQSRPLPPPRTTPAEVAAAMLPCVRQWAARPLVVHGTMSSGWIDSGETIDEVPVFSLYRDAGEVLDPSRRDFFHYAWVDNDPIAPPLVLHVGDWPHSQRDREQIVGCFHAVYPLR